MAGSVMVDQTGQGLEIRAISDGNVMATVPGTPTWWQLATDGSYLVTGNTTALTVYSTSSTTPSVMASSSGNYSTAIAYSAPGQVQVAMGPAGANVIQTVSVTTGSSTVSPVFLGTFSTWFQDGGHFLTTVSTTLRTYSSSGVQQDVNTVTSFAYLGGEGNWFWTSGATASGGSGLAIYQVGASSPTLTVPVTGTVVPSGTTIGILSSGAGQVSVVDLSGSTPVVSAAQSVPTINLSTYAATSPSAWVIGNSGGVILDGTSLSGQPRYLSLGGVWSIAGGTSYVSVAVESGSIFIFNPTTNAQIGTISLMASQLSASTDGTVLAAVYDFLDGGIEPDRNLNVYSLPSGSLINSFPYTYSSPLLTDMTLSGSGTILGLTFYDNSSGCGGEVIAVTGGAAIWCSPGALEGMTLSPDGTEEAALSTNFSTLYDNQWNPTTTTLILQNGTPTASISAAAVGWLDDGHLLANTYTGELVNVQYSGAALYAPAGTLLSSAPVPELHSIQPLTNGAFYAANQNIILSLPQGQVSWASANSTSGLGAASGSEVFFLSGTLVLAQPAATGAAAAAASHRPRLSRSQP
jgi:hypothetical protein